MSLVQLMPSVYCTQAQLVAQSIGRAFHVAYMEFLKANGIDWQPVQQQASVDYQDVVNQQEIFGDELSLFANKELQKEVTVVFSDWSDCVLVYERNNK